MDAFGLGRMQAGDGRALADQTRGPRGALALELLRRCGVGRVAAQAGVLSPALSEGLRGGAPAPSQRVELAKEVSALLAALDVGKGALDLRLARLLAWLKRADLAPTGWTTWRAWCREHVSLSDGRLRQLVRLADSDLDGVKAALSAGDIPLDVALLAPAQTTSAEQEEWLEKARRGEVRPSRRSPADGSAVLLLGEDVRVVSAARERARLLLGARVPNDAADTFILDAFERGATRDELLGTARRPSPRPIPGPPAWPEGDDPATPLLGPWVNPSDVAEAARRVRVVVALRAQRTLILGGLYRVMAAQSLFRELGFLSMGAFVSEAMSLTTRSLQRYRARLDQLERYPAVVSAVIGGLGPDRALLVASVGDEETVEEWLTIARRTHKGELQRGVRLARATSPGEVLARYRHAIATAPRATDRISIRAGFQPPSPPLWTVASPVLPKAAEWFLEHTRIGPLGPFESVKDKWWWTCANPACGRRTLRCEAHHVHFRSLGGTDDPENALCLCEACHLRGVHTSARIQITPTASARLWEFCDGGRTWQV